MRLHASLYVLIAKGLEKIKLDFNWILNFEPRASFNFLFCVK